MKLLLDTCAFLWLTSDPDKVPANVYAAFRDAANEVYFSVSSAWEISIKHQSGRLRLPDDPERYVPQRISYYRLTTLNISLAHALSAGALPFHHKDPFDRMLIAQAKVNELTIATPDAAFAPYGVSLLW